MNQINIWEIKIMKTGTKVIAYWVSNEVGKVVNFNPNNQMVDIKYSRGMGMVTEHISRVKVVNK